MSQKIPDEEEKRMAAKSPYKIFRKYFITGMIVIIPLWVTILVIRAVVNLVNDTFHLLPPAVHPRTYIPFRGIEYLIAFLLIILIGLLASNFMGRKFLGFGESLLSKIPVVKTIYQGVKHLTIGIVGERKIFSRVVLLEYPIKGLLFIGFVTGEIIPSLTPSEGRKMLKVFVPTTPNPTSGFFCIVAEDEVKNLNISVDEAFKLIISAGYADLKFD